MGHNNALWAYRFFLSYSGFGAQPMGHHNASAATKLRSMTRGYGMWPHRLTGYTKIVQTSHTLTTSRV
jgi:hypothetical protein